MPSGPHLSRPAPLAPRASYNCPQFVRNIRFCHRRFDSHWSWFVRCGVLRGLTAGSSRWWHTGRGAMDGGINNVAQEYVNRMGWPAAAAPSGLDVGALFAHVRACSERPKDKDTIWRGFGGYCCQKMLSSHGVLLQAMGREPISFLRMLQRLSNHLGKFLPEAELLPPDIAIEEEAVEGAMLVRLSCSSRLSPETGWAWWMEGFLAMAVDQVRVVLLTRS